MKTATTRRKPAFIQIMLVHAFKVADNKAFVFVFLPEIGMTNGSNIKMVAATAAAATTVETTIIIITL